MDISHCIYIVPKILINGWIPMVLALGKQLIALIVMWLCNCLSFRVSTHSRVRRWDADVLDEL